MNKTEQIYKKMLKEKVVNSNDLKKISKSILGQTNTKYLYRKYIDKLQKEKKLKQLNSRLPVVFFTK